MDLIFTLRTIQQAAQSFWKRYQGTTVFAFHGEMGSGKTTFIHALCDVKQVSSRVSSPTFSIINQYQFPHGQLFHIDLYRLRDEEEAARAGVEEVLYSGDICLVEWPERALKIFPEFTQHVQIIVVDDETRRVAGYYK